MYREHRAIHICSSKKKKEKKTATVAPKHHKIRKVYFFMIREHVKSNRRSAQVKHEQLQEISVLKQEARRKDRNMTHQGADRTPVRLRSRPRMELGSYSIETQNIMARNYKYTYYEDKTNALWSTKEEILLTFRRSGVTDAH